MDLDKILKTYKKKKSYVETTIARIEAYKYALEHPEIRYNEYCISSKELGMPRGSGTGGSPIEKFVVSTEKMNELLKQWIEEDESRMFPLKLEVNQIESAMMYLTGQEKYVIECKYFEGMLWKDIEINVNREYRQQNYITESGLKKINIRALNKLEEILEPLYNRYKVA
jgi:hypothetical protein